MKLCKIQELTGGEILAKDILTSELKVLLSAGIVLRPEYIAKINSLGITEVYIEEKNVQTRLLFSGNLIKHPCFDQIRGTDAYRVVGDLTNTDFVMNNTFWIGVYPGMTDEMIDYMAETIITSVNGENK